MVESGNEVGSVGRGSEVSCRPLQQLFETLQKEGHAVEEFLDGIEVPLARLTDKNERIAWADFLTLVRNLRRIWPDDERWIQLGRQVFDFRIARPITAIARALFNVRDFYRWIAKGTHGVANQNFTCIHMACLDLSPSRLELQFTMKDGYALCRELALLTQGCMQALPTVLGQPLAQIEATWSTQGVLFDIAYVPSGRAFAWIRRLLTWPFTIFRAGRELKETHEALQTRYFDLDHARRVVTAQARQLETAHTISQVVHANLDLDLTLASVATALTSIAQFAGARVSLKGNQEREASSGSLIGPAALVRTLEARGGTIGRVELWIGEGFTAVERGRLLDTVTPTAALALHGASTLAGLLDVQANLERRVEERTAELVSARDALAQTIVQLEEAQDVRLRLFANMNHEIRTPLTVILLAVEQLRHANSGLRDSVALNAITRSAQKLLQLVDALLLLAAKDEDQLTIAPESTDVSALLISVVTSMLPYARACSVELISEPAPALCAEVDAVAIERVLSNLISNAVKFTPVGGRVVVAVEEDGDRVVLSVRDTGVGISEAFLGRIFGRFEQDRLPVRPGASGSGLGLSIVRSLAEAHGGEAEVERLSVGTLFRVRLPKVAIAKQQENARTHTQFVPPAVRPFDEPAPPAAGVTEAGDGRHTVVVVEDDEHLRASLVELLATEHHVRCAATGEEGLALVEKCRPDLLVTDLGLPGIDGFELTRRFRALSYSRSTPVLILTAYGSLERRLEGFKAGATDYIIKPFEPNELLARIRAQLELHASPGRLGKAEAAPSQMGPAEFAARGRTGARSTGDAR